MYYFFGGHVTIVTLIRMQLIQCVVSRLSNYNPTVMWDGPSSSVSVAFAKTVIHIDEELCECRIITENKALAFDLDQNVNTNVSTIIEELTPNTSNK